MSGKRIYLLRHGKVDGPAALYGRTDVAVTEQGLADMFNQTAALKVDSVFCSPLIRCAHFAEVFSQQRDLDCQRVDDFRECDFGQWDGRDFDSVPKEDWPVLQKFYDNPLEHTLPFAESLSDMQKRVTCAWQALCLAPQGNDTLLVTHGGVIRLILAYVLKLDWRNPVLFSQWKIGYGSLTKISVRDYPGALPEVDYVAMPPGQIQ